MAILTTPNPKKYANIKQEQITQLDQRALNLLDNLVNELEQFSGWTFTEFADPNGLVDAADLVALTTIFESRRAQIQLLMDRLNAISGVAGTNVPPSDIPANATAFMTNIGYSHAVYSAQFNKP